MPKATNYSRLKRFYIVFNRDSSLSNNYCVVEASLQADAEMYADHYFQDDWVRVLSSGQWWEYKKSAKNSHLIAYNPEKETT